MLLVSAVYFSRMIDLDDPGQRSARVDAIMEASARNTPALGLTGALILERGWFIQVLEGPRSAVSAMLARIIRDPRHAAMGLADVREIGARRHAAWSMGNVDADTAPDELGRLPDLRVAPAETLHARLDAILESPVRIRAAA